MKLLPTSNYLLVGVMIIYLQPPLSSMPVVLNSLIMPLCLFIQYSTVG